MNKIFWAADSTVQTNDFTTYPQTGIGQVFPLFVKNEYQIVNHAKNGRSTKSFMDEGRLKAIEEKMRNLPADTTQGKPKFPLSKSKYV